MLSFFASGGVVMIPVLVVGGMALVAAGAHAAGIEPAGRAAKTLRAATFSLAVGGVAMDLRVVGSVAASAEDGQMLAIAFQGFSEALAPLVLAGALTALSALFASAGDLRTRP